MKLVTCPHCAHKHIVTSRIPLDVVVVLPCPSCQEFVVFYRERTIGMRREILQDAEPGREKEHIAEALSAYLATDPPDGDEMPIIGQEMMRGRSDDDEDDEFDDDDDEFDMDDGSEEEDALAEPEEEERDPAKLITRPITSHELVTFVESELPRIDDPGYFKRTFNG